VFLILIEEKICYKIVYDTLPLGWVNHRQSHFNRLGDKKSKVKVTLCQRAPRLPASISPTFDFAFGDVQERVFMWSIYFYSHIIFTPMYIIYTVIYPVIRGNKLKLKAIIKNWICLFVSQKPIWCFLTLWSPSQTVRPRWS